MRRRTHPQLAFFPHPDKVIGEIPRERYIWLRALAIQHGYLGYTLIINESLNTQASPFYTALNLPDHVLAAKARKKIVTDMVRGIRFQVGRSGSATFRALVSAMVGDRRELVPTPWLVQQPDMVREVIQRAETFRDSWARHATAMRALQRLPTNRRYWV